MLWLQKIKDSPNYPRIKNSVELKAQRRNALLVWIVTAVLLLLTALTGVGKSPKSTVAFLMTAFFMIPYSLYYVYRVGVLFWKIERWAFSETTLDRPHLGYKSSAWFTVTVRDRSGRELEKTSVDLSELVRRIVIGFEQKLNEKKIEVELDIPERQNIKAEHDSIFQAVYNLMDNAVKFTPA